MSDRADPFWLCHECHAQMRPIQRNGVQHCASCNGEFLEILDTNVNPDPFSELPHPPVRPRSSPPSPEGDMGGSGFFQSMFSSLLGAAAAESSGSNTGNSRSPPRPHSAIPSLGSSGQGRRPDGTGGSGRGSGTREFSFNIGGGRASVVIGGAFGSGSSGGGFPQGGFGHMDDDQDGPLESFFPGFPPGPSHRASPLPGPHNHTHDHGPAMAFGGQGQDLLSALMHMLSQEGNLPPGFVIEGQPGRASMGDYVMTQNGFDEILERLMHAAGPQGPLPATDAVIEGLPRFTFDDKSLEASVYKDCPVCKDDFSAGDEVMRIPCAHVFHPDCLQPWLKTNGSCPVCRFSLVPDEGNAPANATPASTTEAPSSSPTQETASSPQPTQADQPAPTQGQPLFTSILNRLWGQSGAPTSPSGEGGSPTSPSIHGRGATSQAAQAFSQFGRQPTPAMPGQYDPPTGAPPTRPSNQAQSGLPDTSDDPPVPSLSTAIPEDYRERHRQRERERERRQQEEDRQYPSYFS